MAYTPPRHYEAFDTDEADVYDQLADIFYDLSESTADMTEEEAEDYVNNEWLQTLIPLVSTLAPVAARAIGGLVNRNRRPRPSRRPRPVAPRRPTPRPVMPQRPGGQSPSVSGQALNSLIRLLRDPRFLRSLSRGGRYGDAMLERLADLSDEALTEGKDLTEEKYA